MQAEKISFGSMAIKFYLTCSLPFALYSLFGNTDLKSSVAFWFLAVIQLVDLWCGSTSPANFISLCLKILLTVMSCIYFWQGLDRSRIVMNENAGCPAFPQKLDIVIFIFENKSIISDMFCLHVCDSEQLMWFNLNWQFWLWASCETEIEQEHLITGAGIMAQGRRDVRFSFSGF